MREIRYHIKYEINWRLCISLEKSTEVCVCAFIQKENSELRMQNI